MEGSSKSICVRRFSPSALSLFRFHLSPFPKKRLILRLGNQNSIVSYSSAVACENIRFSSLFVAGDVSRGGMSATQGQKFHTDDANQCLHNKSGIHGVPNINLPNFMCLLVDFGIALCSSTNKLQQNSNTSSREDYVPQILTVLLEILHSYLDLCGLLSFVCQDCHS